MKYKITILILGFIASLYSCVDMNLTPLAQGNSESWYSTEEELDMAVNEYHLLGYWRDPLESSEQWTDNFSYRNTHRMDILYGTLNGTQWEIARLWEQSYKLIARANSLLDNIHRAEENGVAADKISRYKAQAYFARACKYADLIAYYGDVVYIDKYITVEEAFKKGRTAKDQVIPLVYADFDNAAAGLPTSYDKATVLFTKGAAYAMKARFALYMGDWAVAAKAAKDCMDLGVYDLHPDFAELFLQSTKNETKEKVFTIPRSIANAIVLDQWVVNNEMTRNPGGYGSACPSWDLLAAFLCTDGLPIDESNVFDSKNPFKNRDPRCTKTIVEFGSEHMGFEYNPHPDAITVMNYTTGKEQTNQDNRANNQYASYNALNWKKGIDISWTENGKQVERDYLIMRYADVLLMYAEAKIELNEIDQTVLDAINKVRARAYKASLAEVSKYPAVTSTDQTELRKTVRIERRMETANEGLRYMDLIRWRLATKALNTKNYGILYPAKDLREQVTSKGLWFWPTTPQIDDDGIADFSAMEFAGQISVLSQRKWNERQYLWPLPTSEVEICPNLKPNNPGY
ncbi:RagB/SusD family nutrient uptake outer membrane protein [Dysgonomonas sp. 511]|uniref:RagB/SusD family nutrient uptake outer membrane protein n=1 Tax=Dysgonomonas sp. 511 TaxID=2302930 RepID=UPI0013D728CE|nr:RagB/SusD family nutrient uptake outer membrane protein [Dysgonomonas sp. 511]NDV79172.1 RagB/SusD family nutrient uptake outer membrane protein [Dysgonomonas sp. 511]